MLYSDPVLTLIGTAAMVPVTVMALDTCTPDGTASVTGVKLPWTAGWTPVVTVNVELTPPMVRVAASVAL